MTFSAQDMVVRRLDGLQDYTNIWQQMRHFTDHRIESTADEIWLLQHKPVFTLGQAGKVEHLINPGTIPVVRTDRGGQMTYHGPGQLILYLLMDLKRHSLGIRDLVTLLENSLIALLEEYNIESYGKKSAPGVYVQHQNREHKIAALGLRVRRGCSYHGLSLNIDVDLAPFSQINPCGYPGLAVTRMTDLLASPPEWQMLENKLVQQLQKHLH